MGSSLHKLIGKSPFASHTASDDWPLPSQLIGIELELEGLGGSARDKLSNETYPTWNAHSDNSLRNGGIEMVLSNPLMGKELSKAISMFFNTMPTFSASSSRASTHVHINMLQEEDTVEVLRNLCSFYYAIEDAMYSCISESRKWAVYASPMSSNFPYEVALLFSKELDRDLWLDYLGATSKTASNNGRHYGFNLKAMRKYGTVEFRHFPAVTSEQELRDWVNLCMEIKKVAVVLDSKGTTTKDFFSSAEKFDTLTDIMPIWGFRILNSLDREAALAKIESLYELLPTPPKYSGNMGSYGEHPLFKDNDKIPKSKKTAYNSYGYAEIEEVPSRARAVLNPLRAATGPRPTRTRITSTTEGGITASQEPANQLATWSLPSAPTAPIGEDLRVLLDLRTAAVPPTADLVIGARGWRPSSVADALRHARTLPAGSRRAFAETLVAEADRTGTALNRLTTPTGRLIRVTRVDGTTHAIIQAYL